MRRPKKNRVKHKALVDFLQSRGGVVRTLQPLTENRRTFGWICHNPNTMNKCIFINKKSSLNGIVSVGERVVAMSEQQNIPIILGLDKKYYRVYGKEIRTAHGFNNNFKNTQMVNFSLHKARAWDVTVIGKFEPLVKDENQLTIDEEQNTEVGSQKLEEEQITTDN